MPENKTSRDKISYVQLNTDVFNKFFSNCFQHRTLKNTSNCLHRTCTIITSRNDKYIHTQQKKKKKLIHYLPFLSNFKNETCLSGILFDSIQVLQFPLESLFQWLACVHSHSGVWRGCNILENLWHGNSFLMFAFFLCSTYSNKTLWLDSHYCIAIFRNRFILLNV